MKKNMLFLLCLLNVLTMYGQELQRKLYTGSDGFKWYLVYDENGGVFGLQNTDGKYIFYSDNSKYEYRWYYTNNNSISNRAFFHIERKNKKIIPQKKKDRKKYVYIDSTCVAMINLEGEVIIPFERGYREVTYLSITNRDFFYVQKKFGVYGACDIHGNEIVEPKYSSLFYAVDGFHGSMDRFGYHYDQLGIELDENNEVNPHAFNKTLQTEKDINFKYYLTYQSGSFGVEDINGKVLIPLSKGYTQIQTRELDSNRIYFLCWKDTIEAAHSMDGKEIIPLSYGCYDIYKGNYGSIPVFEVQKKDGNESDKIQGIYSVDGKSIIPLSLGYTSIYYADGEGYIKVSKRNKVGAYSLNGKVIVKPQYEYLKYTKDGFIGSVEGFKDKKLGIYLPNHKSIYPPVAKNNAVASNISQTSSTTQRTTSTKTSNNNSSSRPKSVSKKSSYSPSSLSYKTWETKTDNARIESVRSSDGMVDETMYMNCVCLSGTCRICAGLGVTGYGMFQKYCNYCGGSGKCNFCGGSGTKVTKKRYRYIDEYYSNGGVALHVSSLGGGPSVDMGGVGSVYYTYGNSKPIEDKGSYYSFGGETVYGVKTNSFRLSKDYKTLWMGNQEYHIIDKAEYDRLAKISSDIRNGVVPVTSVSGSYTGSGGNSGSRNRSGSSSVYTKCTSCNGTGRCTSCNGRGYKFNSYSGHDDSCPSCRGKGSCPICYGRGKL